MRKIAYIKKKFHAESLCLIDKANTIIQDYSDQGYVLSLRQLYYQFVSRGWLDNTEKSYRNLGSLINDGRLAGLVPWDCLEDRTRHIRAVTTWDSPKEILEVAAESYRVDCWRDQNCYLEVWVEKDALLGVLEQVCTNWGVAYFSCRGYASQTAVWEASERLAHKQNPVVLYLGDHDPSGLDMTRDLKLRFEVFDCDVKVDRLALNQDQVDRYTPPPNPAKVTDARFTQYQKDHGDESWELDALEPSVLSGIVDDAIKSYVDLDKFRKQQMLEAKDRGVICNLIRRLK